MSMLIEESYIQGAVIVRSIGGTAIKIADIQITLKGLEYLNDNSLMEKAANLAKWYNNSIRSKS